MKKKSKDESRKSKDRNQRLLKEERGKPSAVSHQKMKDESNGMTKKR